MPKPYDVTATTDPDGMVVLSLSTQVPEPFTGQPMTATTNMVMGPGTARNVYQALKSYFEQENTDGQVAAQNQG